LIKETRSSGSAGFGSGVNLHPHVHVLLLDGVFAGLEKETPHFYPLRAPDDPDVAAVAETTSRRTQALLTRKGNDASSNEEDEDPAACGFESYVCQTFALNV
jgi:hypothetical protein